MSDNREMIESMNTHICKEIEELKKIYNLKNREKIEAERSMIVAIEESHKYFNMTLEYENKITMLETKMIILKNENKSLKQDNRELEEQLQKFEKKLASIKQLLTGVLLSVGTITIVFVVYHMNLVI